MLDINECVFLIILLIISHLPYVKLKSICYFSFISYIVLIVFCVLILVLRVDLKVKVMILVMLILSNTNVVIIVSKMMYYVFSSKFLPERVLSRQEIVRDIYSGIITPKLDINNLPKSSTLLLCNYCNDRVENLVVAFLPIKLAVITKTKIFTNFVDYSIMTEDGPNYDNVKAEVRECYDKNFSILTYITNAPKGRRDVRKMRSGMFRIAKELKIPVTLVAIDYIDFDFINISKQDLNLRVGDTFFVNDVEDSMKRAKMYFRKSLLNFKKNKNI